MSWLAEEVGRDARDDLSRGTCVKRAGFWRAVVKVRKLDDDGNTTWRQRMRNTGVPCSPDDDSGRDLASSAKEAWHDEILSSLVLDLAEKACDRRVEEAVSRAGSRHSEELRKPVVDYIREHVETQLAIGAIERSTARGYRDIVSRYIEPNLPEDRSVEEFSRHDAEGVLRSLVEAGYSNSISRKTFNLMKSALTRAVDVDGLARHPLMGMKAPKPSPPKRNPLSLSDAHDLLGPLSKMRCTPSSSRRSSRSGPAWRAGRSAPSRGSRSGRAASRSPTRSDAPATGRPT